MSDARSRSVTVPVVDLSASLTLRSAGTHRDFRHETSLVEATRDVLASATVRGDTHVVLVSSAIVYGAWENNPVPLEETRTLRPRPEIPEAIALASAEAMVDEWRRGALGRTATVLRPVTVVTPGAANPMVGALARAVGATPSHAPAPAQFLDRGDLDAAIELCRRDRPDGVFNVAPPGMIPSARLRELAPASLRVPLPGLVAGTLEGWRAALTVGPGALAHAWNPWVVSADPLAALGWSAKVSNEEAYVSGTSEGWFASLSAKRRQELALAGATTVALVAGAVVLSWWRRARHR